MRKYKITHADGQIEIRRRHRKSKAEEIEVFEIRHYEQIYKGNDIMTENTVIMKWMIIDRE